MARADDESARVVGFAHGHGRDDPVFAALYL